MGSKSITMADIAKLAGVSASTVSRALNHNERIPEETRNRILKIAQDNNYQLDYRARNFRLQRTQTIAAVVPFSKHSHRRVSDPFYLEMLGVMIDELADRDYGLLVSRVRGSSKLWYEQNMSPKRYDGLIVLAREIDDPGIQALQDMDVNFVVWGAPLPEQEYVSVGYSGTDGVRQAVRHLTGLGRKRIGFIGGNEDYTDTWLRREGYRLGLEDAGLAYQEAFVVYSDYTAESGCEAMERLLRQTPGMDAVVICSDLMAVSAMNVLQNRGLAVPDDIALVGYDDIPLASYCSPALTTLRQDISLAGKLLVEKLFSIMLGSPTESTLLTEELILRDSTDRKPSSDR